MPPAALIGRTIGNYVVKREVGRGGMGTVYVADHLRLRRQVAVKVLHPEMSHDPETVARFFNEARAASDIRNAHIVEILDFGELPEGAPYLLMEWLEGQSLAALLKAEGRLALGRAARICAGIGQALAAAHAHGVVHRDLKPDNVFLARRDDDPEFVKVLDFGIAKLLLPGDGPSPRTATNVVLGTPAYMSPEQCRGESSTLDGRSDVYALGVMLYEMVLGRRPFVSESYTGVLVAHITTPPPPPRTIDPSLPPAVEEVILRALEKERDRRFARIEDLVAALVAAVGPAAVQALLPSALGMPPLAALTTPSPSGMRAPALPTPQPPSTSVPAAAIPTPSGARLPQQPMPAAPPSAMSTPSGARVPQQPTPMPAAPPPSMPTPSGARVPQQPTPMPAAPPPSMTTPSGARVPQQPTPMPAAASSLPSALGEPSHLTPPPAALVAPGDAPTTPPRRAAPSTEAEAAERRPSRPTWQLAVLAAGVTALLGVGLLALLRGGGEAKVAGMAEAGLAGSPPVARAPGSAAPIPPSPGAGGAGARAGGHPAAPPAASPTVGRPPEAAPAPEAIAPPPPAPEAAAPSEPSRGHSSTRSHGSHASSRESSAQQRAASSPPPPAAGTSTAPRPRAATTALADPDAAAPAPSRPYRTAAAPADPYGGEAAALPPPSRSRPDEPAADPLDRRLAAEAARLAPGGKRHGPKLRGQGEEGQGQDRSIQLEAGRCYTIVSVGSPGMPQLYTYLWDPSGRRVATDRSETSTSHLFHCALTTGFYHFQAKPAHGPGEFRTSVYESN